MLNKLRDRKTLIFIFFTFLFIVMIFRLAQITLVEGETYKKIALDMRLKKVTQIARRGEIFDRNGVLLAGNGTTLYLDYLYNYMEKKPFEKMCIDLFTLLEEQGEEHIEFPILIKDGEFIFRSDNEKNLWLKKIKFHDNASAREVFDAYSQREGFALELDPYSRQQLLISKGLYLPIGISDKDGVTKIEFSHDYEKERFLDSYDLDENISPKEAFKYLRDFFGISEELSDNDAYYVLIMKHYIKNLGFRKYETIEICNRISEKTSILITERKADFPDLSIGIKPFRYYPLKNTCSHILGYMGPISTQSEIEKYTEEKGYDHRDLIGKIGIEASYEEILHGKRGVSWLDADSSGEVVGEVKDKYLDERFKNKKPESGLDIQLTIDSAFQKRIEGYVKTHLHKLQNNEPYNTKYSNTRFDKAYPFARTAAVVAVEVESSEVLAMVSYPDYDVNLFTGGISAEDWMSLQPDNKNDPLGPKPMYNIATMTAVQPGSTFKMITSFAALTQGLDPYRLINAKGVITMSDGVPFGCWIWNTSRGSHGPINMIEAIAQSCNYYFYCVGSGYDYGSDSPLEVDMDANKIVEAAKTFGLGESSGVEIDELIMGVPDAETTKHIIIEALEEEILELSEKYFPKKIIDNKNLLDERVNKLIEFGVNTPDAPRYEVFDFLKANFEIDDYDKLNELTDLVKYSYFNQMGSFDSDAFNLAIGQGRNEYTPAQIARYLTTIANGGYLQKLTLIKNINGEPARRDPFVSIDPKGYVKYLQQGMRAAVTDSSYRYDFNNFPIEIALKTGTAEREGKLSTLDEISYIEEYANQITDTPLDEIKKEADKILQERSIVIGNLYTAIDSEKDEHKLIQLKSELSKYKIDTYLDRGNAMREAIKKLSSGIVTDSDIDKFKRDFDNFSWLVAYAPYDKPKIALVIFVPQGGSGLQCFPLAKEILADYFGL